MGHCHLADSSFVAGCVSIDLLDRVLGDLDEFGFEELNPGQLFLQILYLPGGNLPGPLLLLLVNQGPPAPDRPGLLGMVIIGQSLKPILQYLQLQLLHEHLLLHLDLAGLCLFQLGIDFDHLLACVYQRLLELVDVVAVLDYVLEVDLQLVHVRQPLQPLAVDHRQTLLVVVHVVLVVLLVHFILILLSAFGN